MFETIARLSIKFRWLVLPAWIVAPLLASRSLPSLASVSKTSNAQFLSASSPSQHAAALAAPFQGKNAGSTAIIVASRVDGPLTSADNAAISQLESTVAQVSDVTFVRDQGPSQDAQARKLLVSTSVATLNEARIASIVSTIRSDFADVPAPPGLSFPLPGAMAHSAPAPPSLRSPRPGARAHSADAQAASTSSSGNIQKFVLLFVIVLLFIVFR